jgi:hypothetical protein
VSDGMAHLTSERLEQLAEGSLPPVEVAASRPHLDVCARCTAEIEAYRTLFAALQQLPRFAPTASFADGVMARVRIAPAASALQIWLEKLMPSTRRGWILIGTLVTAPATPFIALVAWLLVQPLVTPTLLWQWLQMRATGAAQASMGWLLDQTIGSPIPGLVESTVAASQSIPPGAFVLLGGLMALAIPISAWGLFRLARVSSSRVTYAN